MNFNWNICNMHTDFNTLSDNQWLSASHVDHFIESLTNHNFLVMNPFGVTCSIWNIASVEGMDRSYRPSMVQNNNRNHIFVLVANSNHFVVLSNIVFDQSDQFLDDNDARTNWYMYDTLNDPKHAQSASIAMAKLFPDMSGYRFNKVKVQ